MPADSGNTWTQVVVALSIFVPVIVAAALTIWVLRGKKNDARGWCMLGMIYHDLRRYGDAVTCYRQSIIFDEKLRESHNNLGNTLSDLGRFDDELSEFHFTME